ncbi:MAG: heme-binding protein [Bradyrhizobium sp.]
MARLFTPAGCRSPRTWRNGFQPNRVTSFAHGGPRSRRCRHCARRRSHVDTPAHRAGRGAQGGTSGDLPKRAIVNIPGVVMVGGGMPIEAAGQQVGAIGVSGAPGGDNDDICAKAGIEAVTADLAF